MNPNYVTSTFPKLLENNGLRKIRFHDLRHKCASLLLSNGVPMKQIQEWLGHSDFNTTSNIDVHMCTLTTPQRHVCAGDGKGFAAAGGLRSAWLGQHHRTLKTA